MKGDFTKAKSIDKKTKQAVWERQNGHSLFAPYCRITVEQCCCHYVGRGVSGVGYEWNIIGLTNEEHRLLDESKPIGNLTHEECIIVIENHLKLKYKGWNKDKCKYHKGWEGKDYGITRKKI